MPETLKKTTGYLGIIALTLTALIGTGTFFGTQIAATYSGNASLIAWILLSFVTIYVAACFGELVAMFPKNGGIYEYTKQAYGFFPSFLIGWISWLVANIGTAVIIIAAMDYLFPGPEQMFLKVILSMGVILLFNAITYRGIEASSFLLIAFAIITLLTLLSLIIPGLFYIDPNNYRPFLTHSYTSLLLTLFFILETFFGWEAASFLAEETQNAERVIPRSLLIASVLATLLTTTLVFVTLGIIPWQQIITTPAPLLTVAEIIYGAFGAQLINVGIFLTLLGAASSAIVGSPRLLRAMSQDKLFIEQFGQLHPKYGTPHKAILFQTTITLLILLGTFGRYKTLLSLLVPLALIMYLSILLVIPLLRIKKPELPRPFRVPFGKIGPALVAILYLGILITWLIQEPAAWSQFRLILTFIFFGIPIFILLALFYNPDFLIRMINSFALLNLWLEGFLLPPHVRKKILNFFTDYEGKTILELGAGVGTLTKPLAEQVGTQGKVYALDLGEKNIKLLEKRMKEHGHHHVSAIHDPHLIARIHPSIKKVDMAFSVGNLSYLQDPSRFLKDLNRVMPEGAKICFVEYIDFFYFLPNPSWITNHVRLKELFTEAGFSVQIEIYKGTFWKYLFVYGVKSKDRIPFI
ncbi:MAG TPA: amino acid permease [Candidatus Nanoarchaeia archaeon]|nr:amino acid permease [Candidatus Nanoarchaeia archaeon]